MSSPDSKCHLSSKTCGDGRQVLVNNTIANTAVLQKKKLILKVGRNIIS